jgi:heme oxygenase
MAFSHEVKPNEGIEALRRATATFHERLDTIIRHEVLTSDGALDSINYRRYLQAQLKAHQRLETPIRRLRPELEKAGITVAPRLHRTDWLRGDLGPAVHTVPSPGPVPRIHSTDGVLGVLYTVEGSSLGARHLLAFARRRQERQDQRLPTRFLEGYGDNTGAMWREILDCIAARSQDPRSLRRVTAGARRAFAVFLQELPWQR